MTVPYRPLHRCGTAYTGYFGRVWDAARWGGKVLGPFLRAAIWRSLSLERLNDRAPQILPPRAHPPLAVSVTIFPQGFGVREDGIVERDQGLRLQMRMPHGGRH